MASVRPSARVLLVDSADRVLLFRGADPARSHLSFWFTVGGAVETGEQLEAAALRELAEETGLRRAPGDLIGPVWVRYASFSFEGHDYDAQEWFFLYRHTDGPLTVDDAGWEETERRTISGQHWWHAADLAATTDTIYPAQLGELLPGLLNGWDGQLRVVD